MYTGTVTRSEGGMPRKYDEELGTQAKVDRMKTLGDHADGNGLYLRVREGANGVLLKTWIWRYRLEGKDGVKGLGSVATVPVADARRTAMKLRDGEVLVEEKPQRRSTFEACALQCLDELHGEWSPRQDRLWRQTLRDYAYPIIGPKFVADLTPVDIQTVLHPIWRKHTVTARTLRGRIERVIEWSRFKGHFPENTRNPAGWKFLKEGLAKPSRIHKKERHKSMPYEEIPGLIKKLYAMDNVNADCLAWCILTVTRSQEAIGTQWSEIKSNGMFHVPAERVKQRVELKLTLSEEALALVERRRKFATSEQFVFPGISDQPIHAGALLHLLGKIAPDYDVHGFRATFKTWAEEETAHKNAAIEMALGHTVGNEVERAYMRGELRQQRFELANTWAAYLTGEEDANPKVDISPAMAARS
jgi:integrase